MQSEPTRLLNANSVPVRLFLIGPATQDVLALQARRQYAGLSAGDDPAEWRPPTSPDRSRCGGVLRCVRYVGCPAKHHPRRQATGLDGPEAGDQIIFIIFRLLPRHAPPAFSSPPSWVSATLGISGIPSSYDIPPPVLLAIPSAPEIGRIAQHVDALLPIRHYWAHTTRVTGPAL